jgi:hypothetical protein
MRYIVQLAGAHAALYVMFVLQTPEGIVRREKQTGKKHNPEQVQLFELSGNRCQVGPTSLTAGCHCVDSRLQLVWKVSALETASPVPGYWR